MHTNKLLNLADILLFNPPENWSYFLSNTCAIGVYLKNFHPKKHFNSSSDEKDFLKKELQITENLYQYIFCYKLYKGFKLEKYKPIKSWANSTTMRPCDVGIRIIDLILQYQSKKK